MNPLNNIAVLNTLLERQNIYEKEETLTNDSVVVKCFIYTCNGEHSRKLCIAVE